MLLFLRVTKLHAHFVFVYNLSFICPVNYFFLFFEYMYLIDEFNVRIHLFHYNYLSMFAVFATIMLQRHNKKKNIQYNNQSFLLIPFDYMKLIQYVASNDIGSHPLSLSHTLFNHNNKSIPTLNFKAAILISN